MKNVTLQAADGMALAARVFEPAAAPLGSVVIGGAMGVRQEFYAPFAQWLAAQGWRVTTFDYRGSGDSAPASLRGFRADLFDWTRDYEAAIDRTKVGSPTWDVLYEARRKLRQLPDVEHDPADGWVLFFDGSKSDDSTALVGCRLSDGHVVTLGIWAKPQGAPQGDARVTANGLKVASAEFGRTPGRSTWHITASSEPERRRRA